MLAEHLSAYLEKCRVILNMVDAAESSLLEEKTDPRGRIRLGMPLSFGLQRLMPALLQFAETHSHIELVMDLTDRRSKLIEEGIDLSIRVTSRLEPGDIVRKLGETRLLTVASPQYLAQHSHPTHPHDLAQHACLAYSYLDNGSVVTVLQDYEPEPLGIYAVLPSNRYIPHRVSVLINFLASALATA